MFQIKVSAYGAGTIAPEFGAIHVLRLLALRWYSQARRPESKEYLEWRPITTLKFKYEALRMCWPGTEENANACSLIKLPKLVGLGINKSAGYWKMGGRGVLTVEVTANMLTFDRAGELCITEHIISLIQLLHKIATPWNASRSVALIKPNFCR